MRTALSCATKEKARKGRFLCSVRLDSAPSLKLTGGTEEVASSFGVITIAHDLVTQCNELLSAECLGEDVGALLVG